MGNPMKARNPICPRCGTREKVPGRAYCRECDAECQREYYRKRAEAAPELCSQCRKNRRAPGKSWCRECLTKARAMYRAWAERRKRIKKEREALLADAAACRDILAKMKGQNDER